MFVSIVNDIGFYCRKKSCVQRACVNHASFLDMEVPDNMNAFGIYDYKIGTNSFQSVRGYREYLAKKAGISMSEGRWLYTGMSQAILLV